MKLSMKALFAAAVMSISSFALALPTTGQIDFVAIGAATIDTDANQINFPAGPNNAMATAVSGGFTNYFQFGDFAEFFDFNYSQPFSASTIWTGTGTVPGAVALSFVLESITTVSEIFGTQTAVTVMGTGYITDAIEQVRGTWSITANSSNGQFSWSSSTVAAPEPSLLALFGLGLLGMRFARRRSIKA